VVVTATTDPEEKRVTGKVLHISRKMPAARRRQIAPNGVIGMLIVVVAETMFFAGLISAHTVIKTTALDGWPPPGDARLPIEETLINTAALIASGLMMFVAHRRFSQRAAAALWPMLASLLLGAFFVVFQGMEWVALLREGLTLTSSTHGAFFYLIIGSHGLHALVGVAVLMWAYFRLRRGNLVMSELMTVEIFWYFVVALWPILYWRVYL
jgi:heme/copper-type cytochrome/quinol oxidase subunit 3